MAFSGDFVAILVLLESRLILEVMLGTRSLYSLNFCIHREIDLMKFEFEYTVNNKYT